MAAVVLGWQGGRRLALAFGVSACVIFVVTVGLKAISSGSGGAFAGTPFALSRAAPSGHMAMALAIYGGAGLICRLRGRGAVRMLVPVTCGLAVIVVGVTRVLVGAHTPADVCAAVPVAVGPLMWLARVARRGEEPDLRPFLAAMVAVAVAAFALGWRFSSTTVF